MSLRIRTIVARASCIQQFERTQRHHSQVLGVVSQNACSCALSSYFPNRVILLKHNVCTSQAMLAVLVDIVIINYGRHDSNISLSYHAVTITVVSPTTSNVHCHGEVVVPTFCLSIRHL
jgi:hypothetical protein